MPLGGGSGGTFNGGTISGQTTFTGPNTTTPPLIVAPVVGATANLTDALEINDDVGNLLLYIDAAGDLGLDGSFHHSVFRVRTSSDGYAQFDDVNGFLF